MPARSMDNGSNRPLLILPDYALRRKIGGVKLASLFTPERIQECQAMVDQALAELLEEMERQLVQAGDAYIASGDGAGTAQALNDLAEAAASIRHCMESLGYSFGYEVARLLADYIRSLPPEHPDALLVICKHIAVLNLIIRDRISGDGGNLGKDILKNLRGLIQKGRR